MHHWHGRLWLRHWRSRGPAGPIQYLWFCCVCYYISSLADIVYQNFDACSCSCSCSSCFFPFLFFMCFLFFLFLELIPGSDTFSSRLSGPDPTTCSSSSVCFLLILWEKSPNFVDNTHVYGFCSYFCSLSPCCCCSRCCFELSRVREDDQKDVLPLQDLDPTATFACWKMSKRAAN